MHPNIPLPPVTMSALDYGWEKVNEPQSFWLRFNSCTRAPGTWKDELFAAARSIANRTEKPIWICSSGGIDSEVACRAFFDQGIHFSVFTLEHEAGTNHHDIEYAKKWCRARGVTQKIVKIDMPAFLTAGIDEYAKLYVAIHPFRYLQIKLLELVEEMGGYAVLCSDDQLYRADLEKSVITRADLYLSLSNGNVVPFEWCKNNKTAHEPYFHFSTPELCLSYLRLPLVSFALNNPELVFRHKSNTHMLKRVVYQSIWTDLEVRHISDGFENIKPLFQKARERLRERFESKFIQVDLPLTSFESQLTSTLPA